MNKIVTTHKVNHKPQQHSAYIYNDDGSIRTQTKPFKTEIELVQYLSKKYNIDLKEYNHRTHKFKSEGKQAYQNTWFKKETEETTNFKKELKSLLNKYNAIISFSVSSCSDTHGLYDEKLMAHIGEHEIDLCDGWSLDDNDL